MSKSFSNYIVPATTLVASLVLSACSGGGNKLPILNDHAVSAADDYVRVDRTDGTVAKKVKKLVIPAFNVTYQLKVEGEAVSMAGGDKRATSTDMKVNMDDANVVMMQELTDKAYNIFVAELKKVNYEVVSIKEVAGSRAYRMLNHKKLVTSVSAEDESVTLVPNGLKLYDPTDLLDPVNGLLIDALNINSSVNGHLVDEFGGDDRGLASLTVNMIVQFGNFDLEDHRVSSSIAFNPSFTVLANGTDMEMITDFRPVKIPGRLLFTLEESFDYSLQQNMGSKTNVITGMLNVDSNDGAEEYNATINVPAFKRAGSEQIRRVSQLLVKAIITQ